MREGQKVVSPTEFYYDRGNLQGQSIVNLQILRRQQIFL